MGGYGSGLYGRFGKKPKDTVESTKCLDVRQLSPKPTLGQQEAHTDGQVIKLVWTNCNYGGQRPWFICPKCRSRVGKLYDRNHSLRGLSLLLNLYTNREAKPKVFRCRKCLNLAYESTRKTKSQRLRSKQYKLKEKLNNGLVIPKPKGMHLSTYLKILNQIELLEREIMTQQMLEFDKIL